MIGLLRGLLEELEELGGLEERAGIREVIGHLIRPVPSIGQSRAHQVSCEQQSLA
jgi:hypothetical protein